MPIPELEAIEALLLKAKTGECLQQLREILALADAEEAHNDVFLLLARHNKLISDKTRGIISHADAQVETNTIRHLALEQINRLKEQPEILSTFQTTQSQLVQVEQKRATATTHHWLPESLQRRMALIKERKSPFSILWLDDSAMEQRLEAELIRQLGVSLTIVSSTEAFRAKLQESEFQLHLSCIDLDQEPNISGLGFHQTLVEEKIDIPTVFYIGFVKREKGVPPFAFGITNSPVELLHLVMDVIERN